MKIFLIDVTWPNGETQQLKVQGGKIKTADDALLHCQTEVFRNGEEGTEKPIDCVKAQDEPADPSTVAPMPMALQKIGIVPGKKGFDRKVAEAAVAADGGNMDSVGQAAGTPVT